MVPPLASTVKVQVLLAATASCAVPLLLTPQRSPTIFPAEKSVAFLMVAPAEQAVPPVAGVTVIVVGSPLSDEVS